MLGESVSTEQTEYNSLNGTVITAKSITAEKVNVDDLVAFDATIGGFNITKDSIYSGVKSSVDNQTRGIYLDKTGQMNIGDGNNFIKYFLDPTDNTYKLQISAGVIKMGGTSKSVEETIKEIQKEVSNTIVDVDVVYALSDSPTVAPKEGWSTEAPKWEANKYMWQKTIITYADERQESSEPTCIQGAKGADGEKGADGAKGEKGDKGDKGDPGEQGIPGLDGLQGEKGEQGIPGPKGDPGEPGKDGQNGADGKDGKDAIPLTAEAEGDIITLDPNPNPTYNPIELRIDGKSEQKIYNGLNIFDEARYCKDSVGYYEYDDKKGITILKADGRNVDQEITYRMEFESDHNYIKIEDISNLSGVQLFQYYSTGGFITAPTISDINEFTLSPYARYVKIKFFAKKYPANIGHVIISKEDIPYQPHYAPSSDYESKIKSIGDNINLISNNSEDWEQGSIGDGMPSITNTRLRTKHFLEVYENTEYALSIQNGTLINIWFYDINTRVINNYYGMTRYTDRYS